MRKLIPTTVFVHDLKYRETTVMVSEEYGVRPEVFGKHINGSITIDFTSIGDMSEFLDVDINGRVTVKGLSEIIGLLLIDKEIEI